jgi:hypothetical protein
MSIFLKYTFSGGYAKTPFRNTQLEGVRMDYSLMEIIQIAAVVIQALFTVLVYSLMKKQHTFNEELIRGNRQIEEGANLARMQKDYQRLLEVVMNDEFWGLIEGTYEVRYEKDGVPPVPIYEKIGKEGLPAGLDLSKINKLSKIVREQESNWEQFIAWDYAKYLYSKGSVPLFNKKGEKVATQARQLHGRQSEHTDFWNEWATRLNLRNYLNVDWAKLVMLTWLELARALFDPDAPTKKGFFGFVQEEKVFRESVHGRINKGQNRPS